MQQFHLRLKLPLFQGSSLRRKANKNNFRKSLKLIRFTRPHLSQLSHRSWDAPSDRGKLNWKRPWDQTSCLEELPGRSLDPVTSKGQCPTFGAACGLCSVSKSPSICELSAMLAGFGPATDFESFLLLTNPSASSPNKTYWLLSGEGAWISLLL